MTRVKKLAISLPVGLAQQLDELVRSGRYTSRSALVTEAVRRLLERELPLAEQRSRQKREAEEG